MSRLPDQYENIWDEEGQLVPLNPPPPTRHGADVAIIVVSRNRPDLVDAQVAQLKTMGKGLTTDIYVIEMGTAEDELSEHCSLRYDDSDFRGKCYGHNVGLRLARSKGSYRYYWILMNDLVFESGVDTLRDLVDVADANPDIAVLSPTEPEGVAYPNCRPRSDSDFHLVSTCDYLALLLRGESIDKVGFLNPDFKYCWGAIHELAYKLYSNGWHVAYCDKARMKHLGGTTYGQAKGTISRDEYRHKAMEFAARYFVEHYGRKWDEIFSKALPPEVELSTFTMHRRVWEQRMEDWNDALDPDENQAESAGGGSTPETIGNLAKRAFSRASGFFSKAGLRDQIEKLHPWYYEVEIGGIEVTPGIGSKQTADELRGRVEYRRKILVEKVAKRYDFVGKPLLDIASNCGYWSARYAELGATSLVAVEGRIEYVKQGRLYWKNNRFMESSNYEFIHGNVMKDETWDKVRERAPFDFALCCGILYHVPDYAKVLRNIASVTREAVLIDTRVSGTEEYIEEPGGYFFDAIIETRIKKVPILQRLIELMSELGFETERLSIDGPVPHGLFGVDDYSQGNRITLLATRTGAAKENSG